MNTYLKDFDLQGLLLLHQQLLGMLYTLYSQVCINPQVAQSFGVNNPNDITALVSAVFNHPLGNFYIYSLSEVEQTLVKKDKEITPRLGLNRTEARMLIEQQLPQMNGMFELFEKELWVEVKEDAT